MAVATLAKIIAVSAHGAGIQNLGQVFIPFQITLGNTAGKVHDPGWFMGPEQGHAGLALG